MLKNLERESFRIYSNLEETIILHIKNCEMEIYALYSNRRVFSGKKLERVLNVVLNCHVMRHLFVACNITSIINISLHNTYHILIWVEVSFKTSANSSLSDALN